MAETEAVLGYGSDFQRGDGGSPEDFASVGEITAINGISLTKDTVDATHMQSPDAWEELISSIKRTGEISVDVNYVPNSDASTAAIQDVNSSSPKNYRIVFPDNSSWTFKAHAVGFEIGIPVEDKMTGTFTYKPTGKPAFIDEL